LSLTGVFLSDSFFSLFNFLNIIILP
jgi:hypothetical protein